MKRYLHKINKDKPISWLCFAIIKAAVSLAVLIACPCLLVAQDEEIPLESKLKAACLYNFAKYVKWPDGAFADEQSPLNICVLGSNPFGSVLNALANKTAQNRTINTLEIDENESDKWSNCHIIFYGSLPSNSISSLNNQVKNNGILTVTDNRDTAIINFVMQDEKLRFAIDNDKAKEAGLVISSQMLKLAVSVKDTDSQ